MNTQIEMDKLDYGSCVNILEELYNGRRQLIEAKWEDFEKLPLLDGYKNNTKKENHVSSDISGNTINIDDNNRE